MNVPSTERALRGRAGLRGGWVAGQDGGPEAAGLASVGEIQAQPCRAPLGGGLVLAALAALRSSVQWGWLPWACPRTPDAHITPACPHRICAHPCPAEEDAW